MAERKTVAVCSLKGGAGCSLVATALALAYARRGKRVLLVDLSTVGHTLDFLLGLQDRRLFGYEDLLAGRPAEKTVLSPEGYPNLFLCPASDDGRLLSGTELSLLLEKTAKEVPYDVAVLDLPAEAKKEDFYRDLANVHLVVSTAHPASLLLADRVSGRLEEKKDAFLLLNQFDLEDLSSYRKGRMRVCEMIDLAGLRLIGIVPRHYDLERRSEAGRLCHFEEQIDRPFDNVVSRLEGEERLLFEGVKEGKSLRRSL